MSQSFAIGQYLVLVSPGGEHFRFQNFYLNQTVAYAEHSDYGFLPFGFSGVTVNRQGDNVEAELVFPNNGLSRPWAVEAIQNSWVARVRTMRLNPDNPAEPELLYPYVGQVVGGSWAEATLVLRLSTVLDAVRADMPYRSIEQNQCGPLPVTSNVGL